MRACVTVVIAGLVGVGAAAGAQTLRQAFEVVSVKANRSGGMAMRISAPPGRFEATNVTARLLVLNSHGLADFRVVNLPSWASGRAPST